MIRRGVKPSSIVVPTVARHEKRRPERRFSARVHAALEFAHPATVPPCHRSGRIAALGWHHPGVPVKPSSRAGKCPCPWHARGPCAVASRRATRPTCGSPCTGCRKSPRHRRAPVLTCDGGRSRRGGRGRLRRGPWRRIDRAEGGYRVCAAPHRIGVVAQLAVEVDRGRISPNLPASGSRSHENSSELESNCAQPTLVITPVRRASSRRTAGLTNAATDAAVDGCRCGAPGSGAVASVRCTPKPAPHTHSVPPASRRRAAAARAARGV